LVACGRIPEDTFFITDNTETTPEDFSKAKRYHLYFQDLVCCFCGDTLFGDGNYSNVVKKPLET